MNFLAGRTNELTHDIGEKLAQPRAAGKNIGIRLKLSSIVQQQPGHHARPNRTGARAKAEIVSALLLSKLMHEPDAIPRRQGAGSMLQPDRPDPVE